MTQLFTIGYTSLGASGLIAALRGALVEQIWDVRQSAWSRHPAWRLQELSALMRGAGIAYRHRPALGNAYRHEARSMAEIFAAYRAELIRRGAPDALARELRAGPRVALLCGCEDHNRCHRSVLAEEIAAAANYPIEIVPLPPKTGDLFA